MPTSPKKPSRPPIAPVVSGTPDVDPRWLLKMLGVVLGAALLCGYLTLCLLFYQGQWQFILHPDITNKATPAAVSLPFEDVAFDVTEAGQPQLHGWWIPAATAAPGTFTTPARYGSATILYLHGGTGSLADTLPPLKELHDAGLNIFAFDYRGFGQSAGPHPNQQRMQEDAEAAWSYVTHTRRFPATHLIPYGEGIGGGLVVHLLQLHPRIPAIILDRPVFDIIPVVRKDPRTTLIPVRLLFRERFEIAKPLATLETPKLLFIGDDPLSDETKALNAVADPKFTIHTGISSADARSQSLSRFLDEYLPDPALIPQ